MKLVAKWIVLPVFLILLIVFGALALIVDDEPMLRGRADLTPERIAHGKQVFEQNDPRRLKPGAITRASLAQEDLDLAINYFANQYLGGAARLGIENHRAIIKGSLKLPANPLGRFLNIEVEFKEADGLPRIDHLMLGRLWFPGFLAEALLIEAIAVVQPSFDMQPFADMIRQVRFEPRQVTVIYRWQGGLPGKLSSVLWSEQDQQRLEFYQLRLVELTQDGKNSLQLVALTQPLFQLARDRSKHGDAVAENRALILVLAFYVNQKDLKKIIPLSQTWPRTIWRRVTLNGRDDFTKHYLVSAMLAAYAGTPLSYAVGLYKEIEDARGGSGFSFNDLAADRAGTRMGKLAVGSESQAVKIQMLMATANESDIMPATEDLPEFMSEATFNRRFGGTQGEKYRQMLDEIDKRVAALPINSE